MLSPPPLPGPGLLPFPVSGVGVGVGVGAGGGGSCCGGGVAVGLGFGPPMRGVSRGPRRGMEGRRRRRSKLLDGSMLKLKLSFGKCLARRDGTWCI